jgi:hypothetical protein
MVHARSGVFLAVFVFFLSLIKLGHLPDPVLGIFLGNFNRQQPGDMGVFFIMAFGILEGCFVGDVFGVEDEAGTANCKFNVFFHDSPFVDR